MLGLDIRGVQPPGFFTCAANAPPEGVGNRSVLVKNEGSEGVNQLFGGLSQVFWDGFSGGFQDRLAGLDGTACTHGQSDYRLGTAKGRT